MSRFDFPLLDRIAEMVTRHLPSSATLVDEREAARARTLVSGIPWSNPLRPVVDRLLKGIAPTGTDIRPLLPILLNPSGFRWKERYLTAWVVGYAALEAQERRYASDWLIVVVQDRIGADTAGRWLRATLRAMIPAGVLSVMGVAGFGPFAPLLFIPLTAGFAALIAPFSFKADAERRNSVRAAAVRSLGRLAAPHAITTVACALYDAGLRRRPGRVEVRRAAQEALPALAQAVRIEDRSAIGPDADAALCKALAHPDDVIVYHAMHALSTLGSERALKSLQALARRGRSPAIREAARKNAGRLQEVLAQAHQAETLLRPAHAPGADPDTLLRPAPDVGQTDPELLLRPSSCEDEP